MITDGMLTLSPLRLEDAAAHLAGEDTELVRWLNGGQGTLPGVQAYIRRTIELWAAGGPKLAFGIRAEGVLAGTIDVDFALPSLRQGEANLAYGLYPAGGAAASPPAPSCWPAATCGTAATSTAP